MPFCGFAGDLTLRHAGLVRSLVHVMICSATYESRLNLAEMGKKYAIFGRYHAFYR